MIDTNRILRYNVEATYYEYFICEKGHTTPCSVISHFPFRGNHDMWQYRETHYIGYRSRKRAVFFYALSAGMFTKFY